MHEQTEQGGWGTWKDDRLVFDTRQRPILIIGGRVVRFREGALIQARMGPVGLYTPSFVRRPRWRLVLLDYRCARRAWTLKPPFRGMMRPSGRYVVRFEGWEEGSEFDSDARRRQQMGYRWFGRHAGVSRGGFSWI